MGAPDWVDVFPIKNTDIPASYVRLTEGNHQKIFPSQFEGVRFQNTKNYISFE